MIIVQILLLAVHLLAMNVAAAGPLLCVWLQFLEARNNEPFFGKVGRRLAFMSAAGLVIGIAFGLLNAWLMWNAGEHRFFDALERLPSKIYYGLWELGFYAVCMLAYIEWWRMAPPRRALPRVLHAILGVAAGLNLLWHFPLLMAVIAYLASHAPIGEEIDAQGFRTLIFQAQIASRWLHVWMASIATSSLLVCWIAQRFSSQDADDGKASTRDAAAGHLIAWGGRAALAATLLQLPLGMWLLMSSPAVEQSRILGSSIAASVSLAMSVMCVLALLHQLAGLAMANGDRHSVRNAWLLLIAIVVLMSGTLRLARGDSFEQPTQKPRASTVAPQYRQPAIGNF